MFSQRSRGSRAPVLYATLAAFSLLGCYFTDMLFGGQPPVANVFEDDVESLLEDTDEARDTLEPEVFWTQVAEVASYTPASIVVTATAAYHECSWQWATQELPEVTGRLGAALDAAEITYATVRAYAYGENCITASGEIDRFATMETDFDITLPVDDLSDRAALGNLAAEVLALLVNDFPADSTPGPNPGRIVLVFDAGGALTRLIVQQSQAAQVVDQGLDGEALLDELGY